MLNIKFKKIDYSGQIKFKQIDYCVKYIYINIYNINNINYY